MPPTVLTAKKTTPEAEQRAAVRVACQVDLYRFAKEILYAHLTPNLLTDTLHLPLCDWMLRTPYEENLYLLSRGFFKSSIITTAAVIQRIVADPTAWWCQRRWRGRVCGPNTRILLASNKGDNAQGFLAGIKGHLESNDKLLWLFPEILVRDPQRQAREWTQTAITVERSRRDLRESTIQTIGVEGELVSRHYDHGVFDDCVGKENSASKSEREKVWDFLMKARPLFDPGATKDYVGCLAASTDVTLLDGTRVPIEQVKVGDRVWTAGVAGALTGRMVTAMIPQGLASTLTVTTTAHTLRATPTHPFLALRDGGLHWVRADALRPGEYVVALKEIPGGASGRLSDAFVWFFGFLMGDGWASIAGHRGHIGIALGTDETLNARVLAVAAQVCPYGTFRVRPAIRTARNDSRKAAEWIQELGLVGTAKTKRLPGWVFLLSPGQRRALLRGFCDADGTRVAARSDVWRVEIANRGLLEDLRHLASLCGIRTGRLRTRTRLQRAPNSPAPTRATSWDCSFNFSTPDHNEFRHMGRGQGFRAVPPVSPVPGAGLRPERVVSVVANPGLEPVYDLTVEGTPAFFANGLAVHNTHWHYADAWMRMKAQRQRGQRRLGVYEVPCWRPTEPRAADDPEVRTGVAGQVPGHGWVRVVFPERFCLDKPDAEDQADNRLALLEEWRGEPSNFNAQYLLNPVSAETAHFPRLDPKGQPNLQIESAPPPLEDLWVAMAIDPAQSLHKWADYSGIAVGGFDRRGDLWLLELWMARRNDEALVRKVFDLVEQFRSRGVEMKAIGFEAVGFAKGLRHVFTIEGDRRGFYLPILAFERDTTRTKQQRIGLIQGQWMSKQIHALDTCEALPDFLDQADKFRMDQENESDDLLDPVADLYQLRGRPSEKADPFASDEIAQRARWEQALQATRPEMDRMSLRIAYAHHQATLAAQQDQEARALSGGDGMRISEIWG